MTSIAELLLRLKEEDQKGVYFFEAENKYGFMPYKELYITCLEKLRVIQEMGIKKGDKVIFQINDNKNFIILFWSCILGGIIPVPLTLGTNSEQINKLIHVFRLLKNSKVFMDNDHKKLLIKEFSKKSFSDEDYLVLKNTIVIEDMKTNQKEEGIVDYGSGDDIAFIQFSSGSTDMAKGVMLSHNNLIVNIEDIVEKGNILESDFTLGWLPLTHDMGMIGFHLTPIYRGINFLLMKTLLFLRKPELWITACSKFKVTQTSSPNFGYKYFLDKVKGDEWEWDLSNLKSIFNGAEPIDVDLALKFIKKLKKYGLRESSMYTVYGMAEACLGVTFPVVGEKMRYLNLDRKKLNVGEPISILDKEETNGIKFSNNGTPLARIQIKILDDDGTDLGQDKVGNIYIKGKNITRGYYENEEYTNKNITEEGWLNTGDIGFINEDCIYITGRKKEVIILNGYNYYAHDIERICENMNISRKAQFVAAAVYEEGNNEEKLAIFVKYSGSVESFKELSDRIKQELYSNTGIIADYVIPVKTIYKTTSGKVKRYQYTIEFLQGKYNHIIQKLNNTERKTQLNKRNVKDNERRITQVIEMIKEELNIEKLDLDENLVNLGIDSLKLMKIQDRINKVVPNELTFSDFYSMSSVRNLSLIHI